MPIDQDIYYHLYHEEATLPVVLIHGAGGMHLSWPAEIRRLEPYRIYALDLPGHGKSTGRGQQSIEDYASCIVEWMARIDLPRAVLVGHSMGGATALSLALEHPELVLGMALLSSGPKLAVNPLLLEEVSSPTTFPNAVQRVVEWSFSEQAEPRIKELVAERMLDTRSTVLHGDFLACNGFDLSEQLAEIRCPTLVICGSDDRMTPVRDSQYLADYIPSAKLVILPGSGHMVMLEKPAEVAANLREFLDGISF